MVGVMESGGFTPLSTIDIHIIFIIHIRLFVYSVLNYYTTTLSRYLSHVYLTCGSDSAPNMKKAPPENSSSMGFFYNALKLGGQTASDIMKSQHVTNFLGLPNQTRSDQAEDSSDEGTQPIEVNSSIITCSAWLLCLGP